MEQENKEAMEHLRATLLKDIELQEQIRIEGAKFQQRQMILSRRQNLLSILMSILIIISLAILSYLIVKPLPLRELKQLQQNLLLEKQLIQKDRDDVARARKEFLEMQRNKFKQDSLDTEIKKLFIE